MDIDEVPLDPEIVDVFRKDGIKFLYPPQKEALDHVFAGRSTVVSVPTASGKTLIAYMAILRAFSRGLKSIYVVPLRALAMEKYEELRNFEKFGLSVALAMGDFDAPSGYLKNYDVIVATSEKMDSILRHNPDFAYEIGAMVVDEIHLLGEESRGPTLEMVITKIRALNEDVQILGLSATVANAAQLAEWLNAELVYSDFRPVPLKLGVYVGDTIYYDDNTVENLQRDSLGVGNLVMDRIAGGGQILIFVNRRKSTESLATKLQRRVLRMLTDEELAELEKIANEILEDEYSAYGEKIAKLIKHGVAFHHAGLSNRHRKLVEDGFKKRLIKVIVATPTLAAGINLPSRTVIVRDLARYDGVGMAPLPVMEVKQMLGRAGRPRYDRYGEGILMATSEKRAQWYMENYILGDVEDVESQLSSDRALRIHLLALIATDMAQSVEEIMEFFKMSFYGFSLPVDTLSYKIEGTLRFLVENDFVEEGRFLRATPLGRRVAELYVDPLSALMFKKCYALDYDEFCILHTISATPDMRPLYAKKAEIEELLIQTRLHPIAVDEFSVEPEKFFGALKIARILEDWISEATQDSVVNTYDIGPGDLHSLAELADWLLYSFAEIGKTQGYPHFREVEKLRLRVKYGVSEELLPIVMLRGVGRVRARRLFDYGFTSIEKLRSATVRQLTDIPGIGERLAKDILRQVQSIKD
ncbi:MAG: DEAD/DEAH box helicase [Euryarchaeota archaeon]|nr:DEAD/DEAH box helicase [Euryarchaeota archaeon]